MSRRELTLLIATLSVFAIFIGFRFLPEGGIAGAGFGSGQLENERQQLRTNKEWIEEGQRIRKDYERVEAQFPEKVGNRSAEATFSDELTRMVKELGWNRPKIKPPRKRKIKDVEDYYYIDLDVEVVGNLDQTLALVGEFLRKGLLIKSFEISKTNPDGQNVRSDVTVSRLAKVD